MVMPWEKDWTDPDAAQAATTAALPWEMDWTEKKKDLSESGDFVRGLKVAFKQLPQLGYGMAALSAATLETALGEDGLSTAAKKWAVEGYKRWGESIQKDSKETDELDKAWERAKDGDAGALVDWVQYGLGYVVGQTAQLIGTAGVGTLAGRVALRPAAEKFVGGMVTKEAERIAAASAGKLSIEAATAEAAKNVAGQFGRWGTIAATAAGMEGGEIGGELVSETDRALTGAELAQAWGGTAIAGALEFAGDALGLSAITGKLARGVKGRVARASVSAAAAALGEGATEYGQTIAEQFGKGKDTLVPWDINDDTKRQALNAAALGALGGTAHGAVGGALTKPAEAKPDPVKKILDAKTPGEAIGTALDAVHVSDVAESELGELVGRESAAQRQYREEATRQREEQEQAARDSAFDQRDANIRTLEGRINDLNEEEKGRLDQAYRERDAEIGRLLRERVGMEESAAQARAAAAPEKGVLGDQLSRARRIGESQADYQKRLEAANDRQARGRVSGEVGVGQEPVQAGDEQRGGATQVAAGRVLQAQGADRAAGGEKPVVAPAPQPSAQAGAGATRGAPAEVGQPPAAAVRTGQPAPSVAAPQQKPSEAKVFGRPVHTLTDNALRVAATNHRMSAFREVALREIERRKTVTTGVRERIETAPDVATAKTKAVHSAAEGASVLSENVGVDLTPTEFKDAPITARLAARAVKRAFGKEVVFVRGGETGYDARGRAKWGTDGGMLPSDPSRVYVNLNSNRKWQAVIGHETTHALKRTNQAVYDELRVAVNAAIKDEAFTWAEKKYAEAEDAIKNEEIVANIVGDQMSDPRFWLEVFKRTKNPRALANAIFSALDKMRAALVKSDRIDYNTKEFTKDHSAVRSAVAKAYAQWEKSAKGEQPRTEGGTLESKPTKKSQWAKQGDNVESEAGMRGVVQRIVETASVPYAVVKWESGSTGRHTLSTLRVAPKGSLESKPADRSAEPFRPANATDMKVNRIPPGWTDVYVAANPNAALVAVGTDKRGRTQYLYSAAHTSAALADKFKRLRAFNDALPSMIERIEKDAGAGREEAVVMRLIANTGFRVGAEEVRGEAEAVGATTLRAEHVEVDGDTVKFDFPGKRGVLQIHSITNAEIARDIEERMKGGNKLFKTTDARVRNYMAEITGGRFKVHDFRTWNATDAARQAMAEMQEPTTPEAYWTQRDAALEAAANKIGDTQAVAEEVYVDKLIFEEWRRAAGVEENATRPRRKRAGTGRADEGALRDASLQGREPEGERIGSLQSKPDRGRAADQAAGESNANPLATARAAVAYNRANAPDAERLGECHRLTWRKVALEETGLRQIIGIVNGWADRARPRGDFRVGIWHSVAYDPKTKNIWEPITNRWYTLDAMKAFGFEPVASLDSEAAQNLAMKTKKVPDQQIYSENVKPLRGAEKDHLLPEDYDANWKILGRRGALESKPDDETEDSFDRARAGDDGMPAYGTPARDEYLEGLSADEIRAEQAEQDRQAIEEDAREQRYFSDDDFDSAMGDYEPKPYERGEFGTMRRRPPSRDAQSPTITWAVRPRQGEWMSAEGNGHYTIMPTPDGYIAFAGQEEVGGGRTRAEAIDYLNDRFLEDIAAGTMKDPYADLSVTKKFTTEQISRVVDGMKRLASAQGIFRLPVSKAKKLVDVLREVDTEKVVKNVMPLGGGPAGIQYRISFNEGAPVFVTEELADKTAYVSAEMLRPGSQMGSFVYPAIMNWAKNNGLKLVADPSGLSRINTYRRTEQMLSAALKFGSTEFLSPWSGQLLYGWNENPKTKAEQDKNLAIMALTSMENTLSRVPEAQFYTYNFDKKQFEDEKGKTLDADDLQKMAGQPQAREYGIGRTTLARAIFMNTLVKENFTPREEARVQRFLNGKIEPSELMADVPEQKRMLSLYSKPESREVTKTPEFKEWFGDSKVVDENGEPMVMYHGTDADIKKFDIRTASWESLLGQGFYFSKSAEYASGYARGRGANVMPVYLSIQNPAPLEVAENIALQIERSSTNKKTALRDALEKRGYDGVITHETVTEEGEPDDLVAMALRPEQIKSAIGNRGTFSKKSASILESKPSYVSTPVGESAARKAGLYRPEKPWKDRLKGLMENAGKKFQQGLFDQFAPIKTLDYRAYMMARMSKGTDGAVEAMFLYGKPHLEDGALNVRMEDGGLTKILQRLQGEHDRFIAWIAGNRAAQLKAEGRERLFEDDEIAWLKDLNQGQMSDGSSRAALYAEVHREFNAYSKAVLDIAEEQGLIDGESRSVWEKDFYVPFYRNMEDEVSGPTVKSGLVSQQAFKRLKGGKEELNDLLENTLQNWSHLLSASMKNKAALTTLEAAVNAGAGIEVPSEYMGKQMQIGKVLKALDKGSERYFVIDDPFVMDAIRSLETFTFGPIGKVFTTMKRWLTIGVTANPAFKIRNLLRDSISAIGVAPLSYNPYKNVTEAWKLTAHNTQERATLLASGGIIRFGTQLEGSRAEYTRDLINKGVPADTILDKEHKVVAMLKLAWDHYQEFGDRGENVNRAALYKQLRDEGKDHLEASYASRDLMDFSMQGTWNSIRFLSQTVPFFNARLQGLYKLGRAYKEDPKRLGYVTGAVMLASMALLLAYKDDPDWKKREDWDRDNFWWFKIPGWDGSPAFRIPKPFEIGTVGSFAERLLEYGISNEMTGKRLMQRVGSLLLDNLSFNPTPQLVKPLIELYANKDFFRGRDIETQGMERLSPSQRVGRNTTALAQILGKANVLSPVQIDHLIRAYAGWLGTSAVTVLDYGLRPAMGMPDKASPQLKDAFLIGNFIEGLPTNTSRYVTDFYEQSKKIEQAYADWRQALNLRQPDKAKELRESEKEKLALHAITAGTNRQLAAYNKLERIIEADTKMSASEKRSRLDRLDELKHQSAKRWSDSVLKRRGAEAAAK